MRQKNQHSDYGRETESYLSRGQFRPEYREYGEEYADYGDYYEETNYDHPLQNFSNQGYYPG